MTQTIHERVGEEAIRTLVQRFYAGVADDELLRPMYPEEDLGPAEERLALFLIQLWGGPSTYHEQRGHPRLRLRHAPFAVTPTAAQHWLQHMLGALDSLALPQPEAQEMRDYFLRAAVFLVNSADEGDSDQGPAHTLPVV